MKSIVITAAALVLSLAFGGSNADAHSKKEGTQPANGAVLQASPATIGMRFEMPMRVTLITLTDQNGAAHDLTRTDNMQPVTDFSAAPAMLPAGKYKVEWRGLATDGRPMQGTFSFEISN